MLTIDDEMIYAFLVIFSWENVSFGSTHKMGTCHEASTQAFMISATSFYLSL